MRSSCGPSKSSARARHPRVAKEPQASKLQAAMKCRNIRAPLPAAGLASVLCIWGAVDAQPSTDQILAEMGFSAAEQRRVLDGEFDTAKLVGVSDRDLA